MKKRFFYSLTLALALTVPSLALAEGSEKKGQMKQRLLEKFDTNKDGTLDETEREAARAFQKERKEKMLEKFDTNKDGKLDEAERKAAREARKNAKRGKED
jgi:Ca2+-binding EF-hand superfamily protein